MLHPSIVARLFRSGLQLTPGRRLAVGPPLRLYQGHHQPVLELPRPHARHVAGQPLQIYRVEPVLSAGVKGPGWHIGTTRERRMDREAKSRSRPREQRTRGT